MMTRRTEDGAVKCALRHFRRLELTLGEYFMAAPGNKRPRVGYGHSDTYTHSFTPLAGEATTLVSCLAENDVEASTDELRLDLYGVRNYLGLLRSSGGSRIDGYVVGPSSQPPNASIWHKAHRISHLYT